MAKDRPMLRYLDYAHTLKSNICDNSDNVLPISKFEASQYINLRLNIAREKHEIIGEIEKSWLCHNHFLAPLLCYL